MPAEHGVQSSASQAGRVPEAVTTERVKQEWRARIAAEYTSAAITQQLVLWLIQAGAPPDLIDAGLAIVADELAHSRMSHEVYTEAGGSEPPAIDRTQLGIARASDLLELDILHTAVRVFCLGETVAVPLFRHLRERCTEATARAALDRILRDEVRHRDFGWDMLDWLCASPIGEHVPRLVAEQLPAMLAELEQSYGTANPTVAGDDGEMTEAERAWGLAPPREYAAILAQTIEKDYR
ncbi:MAG TPA: ferritin-like domain-containing protein, partial [Kofleriaceae bacterium]